MGDNDHANAANEQVRQAKENGTIPESRENYSSIRLVVDGEKLTADNPIDYLVMLLLEGKRYDGNWEGDETELTKWAIASWCQEIGWAPDLTDYDAGEQVGRGDEIACCDAAFYGAVDDVQEEDDSEDLAELVDDHERGVVASSVRASSSACSSVRLAPQQRRARRTPTSRRGRESSSLAGSDCGVASSRISMRRGSTPTRRCFTSPRTTRATAAGTAGCVGTVGRR